MNGSPLKRLRNRFLHTVPGSRILLFSATLLVAVYAVLISGISGCTSRTTGAREGVIEYEIAYPESIVKDNFFAGMLPTKMLMKFKDDVTRSEVKVGMGIMVLSFIANPDNEQVSTLFDVVDKKWAFVMDGSELKEENEKHDTYKIKYTDEVKEIAGFKCKKAIIESREVSFPVYYTKDIGIKNPNWWTYFNEIDGTLMEYSIKTKEIEMKLTASGVYEEKQDSSLFSIPPAYNLVANKDSMPEIFHTIYKFFR
jgi:hypothetical protein